MNITLESDPLSKCYQKVIRNICKTIEDKYREFITKYNNRR